MSDGRRRGLARDVGIAFAVGLAARVAAVLALRPRPAWDGLLYERAARQLAAGEGYTQRIFDPGWWPQPTAFYPPGWPGALAAWKLLGLPPSADLLLQAMLGALAIPLAAVLARRALEARVSAWLVALWPGGVLGAVSWMTEPLFTLLLLLALCPLAPLPSPARRARPGVRLAASALLFGLAALVRPTALVIAPFALAAFGWRTACRRRGLALALLCAPLALVPPAPWIARNAVAMGAPAITTSVGANLHLGTHHARFARIPDESDCPAGPPERVSDRCHRDRALARIAEDPLGWVARGALKVAHTFAYEASPALVVGAGLGDPHPERRPGWNAVAVLCSLFWLALAALASSRRPRGFALVVVASLAGLALTHFVFFGGDRYHVPLVPLVAVVAAPALLRAALRVRRRRWTRGPRRAAPIGPDGADAR